MNPRGQVAPQALLENVFENQELGGRGEVTFRVPFGGKTAPGSPFFEGPNPLLRPERSRKSSQKWLQKKLSENGASTTTTTTTTTTTDRFWPIWTPGADPLIWQNRCAMVPKSCPQKVAFLTTFRAIV